MTSVIRMSCVMTFYFYSHLLLERILNHFFRIYSRDTFYSWEMPPPGTFFMSYIPLYHVCLWDLGTCPIQYGPWPLIFWDHFLILPWVLDHGPWWAFVLIFRFHAYSKFE